MGVILNRKEGNATLAVWEIVESEDELCSLLSIPKEEREDLAITKSESRRKERLAVRALINELFDSKVYLGHHDNGKPYLVNSSVEISISHTDKLAAIIVHEEESVGIDIESLSRNFSAVEKRALSKSEIELIEEENKSLFLAIFWSAKEAIYKRMSLSNIDFAEQITISKINLKTGEIKANFITPDKEKEYEFDLQFELFHNHILTWLIG